MTPWYSWAFDGVAGAAVVGIGIAVYQRYASKVVRGGNSSRASAGANFRSSYESPADADISGPITDSQVAVGSNISQSVAVHHHYAEKEIPQKLTPTEPTPLQIMRAIKSVKPYDKHREREKFIDLEVTWRVKLSNMHPTAIHVAANGKESMTNSGDGAWLVTCVFRSSPVSDALFVQFLLSDVPLELKIAERDASFLVQGRIEKVSVEDIYLRANPKILGFESS
jgi:hypothetical protein